MPRPHEIPAQHYEASYNVLNKEEQEALDYYLEGGSRSQKRGYAGPERRSLSSQIDRLIFTVTGMKMHIRSDVSPGEQMVNHFQDFAPVTLQEGMTLLEGATKRISRAENTGKGEPEEAVKDRYYTFAGYLLDAAEDLDTLNRALKEHPGGGLMADADYIRATPAVHEVFAKQLMSRGFLWDRHWPSRNHHAYQERHKYWLGFTVAAARFASDEALAQLLEVSRRRSKNRLHAWVEQMGKIEDLPAVQRLIADQKVIPLSYSRIWHSSNHQLGLGIEEPPERTESTVNYADIVSPEVKEAIERQQKKEEEDARLADEEWDRAYEKKMQIPFMTTEKARAELLREGIGSIALQAADQIPDRESDAQEILEIAERARRLDERKKEERKTRKTRGRRFRARFRDTTDHVTRQLKGL